MAWASRPSVSAERLAAANARAGRPSHVSNRIDSWIGDTRFGEAFLPQQTAIASPAGAALRVGVVATVRHGIVDAKLEAAPDDLGFGQMNERIVHGEGRSLGAEPRGLLKTFDELRTAVGVAAVIQSVHADENIVARSRLPPKRGHS